MNRLLERLKKYTSSFRSEYNVIPEQIFQVIFIMILIIDCIENTSVIYSQAFWLKGMYLFRNLLYLVLLFKIAFLSTYKMTELIGIGVVFLIGFASLLGSGDFGLLRFFIIAFAAKNESPRKLMGIFIRIKGASIILTLLLWRIGLLSALYYQDDKVGYYNTYGFCHRNVLGANVALICLAWFYLRYRKLKIQDVVIWAGIGLLTYKLAVSRTSFLVMILTIAGFFFFQKKEEYLTGLPNLRKIILGGFIGILLLSIICTLFYSSDSSVWVFIDKIFTKRFRFANYCFEEYGLSLFGQKLPFVSSIEAQNSQVSKLILDNAYMRVLLYYGLIPGTLFLGAYYKAMDLSFKKKDWALLGSLAVFAIYGLSERYMLDVFYQFPLLIACIQYFFSNEECWENEKKPLEHANDIIQWCKRNKRKKR
ncbi:MAG: hypothetical protein ACI4EO_06830 [Blautia sp.]